MADFVWIARRTAAVLRREGLWGTAQRIVKYLRIAAGAPSPESIALEQKRREDARLFDTGLGVETGGTLPLYGLTIRSRNAALGVSYIATGPVHFRNAMNQLDIDVADCTFVDLGAGKGRVLMMAAKLPFRAIIGVEFAEELHAICQQNIARFGDARIRCELGDAEQFAFPQTDLVVYMNNPFDPVLVAKIRSKIEASARANPRTVRVVYVNAPAPELFSAEPWRRVGTAHGVDVFALQPASSTQPAPAAQ